MGVKYGNPVLLGGANCILGCSSNEVVRVDMGLETLQGRGEVVLQYKLSKCQRIGIIEGGSGKTRTQSNVKVGRGKFGVVICLCT